MAKSEASASEGKGVKLVAVGTIRRGAVVEAASTEVDPKTNRVVVHPAKTDRKIVQPGEEFNAVDQAEADALIASGAARLQSDKPVDPPAPVPVAPNTAPRLPKSGDTVPPDPDAVAEKANEDTTDETGGTRKRR